MKQLQYALHNINENVLRSESGFAARRDTGLCKLDVPVAVDVPDKVEQVLNRDSKLECLEVCGDVFDNVVVEAEHPLVLDRQIFGKNRLVEVLGEIHQDIARCVPQLVCEVAGVCNLLLCPAHIVSGRVACNQRKAKRVRAVLVDDFERVNAVAERL